ncbi:enoyl-[acyl-carrier-protein] reductase FabI [Sphingomonas oleivorans]|uniref:Enoyl-[acyl-carrier-protein] reductase [NADH] n=2 Tax=Sphingomonas oleivorans TaxID=1735121 RepID=A0A2T5FZ39_9SPHN|nr:enoyl-[acyl-carrier-protein] reductase FabI [Sphingomonas oleivorans]
MLAGKVGLVVGVANAQSIATGCARAFRDAGAELALTYLNDEARPYVEPVARDLDASLFEPLDVEKDQQLDALFRRITESWGRLDFLLHSIAYCRKEDLHGRVVDCSREGFAQAMDISVHSLIRMTRRAEPLMGNGGCILTVSYYGAEKVVDHYNIMGPVKAALEATVRSLAAELGPRQIRVNALSPGPVRTRAASGIEHFDELIEEARARAPERRLVTIEDIGAVAAGLVSDAARSMTGNITYVDAGYHIMS